VSKYNVRTDAMYVIQWNKSLVIYFLFCRD